MIIGTDTLSEIDSRRSEAIPVKEMASPIESTRQVLQQLFGLDCQTEPLLVHTEMKRRIIEKEFQLESLARDLLTELKALKNTVSSTEATHGKQVEAIHESYRRMIGLRPTEDKSKSEAMRRSRWMTRSSSRPSSVLHAKKSRTRCTSSRRTSNLCSSSTWPMGVEMDQSKRRS